jgi:short-subunit dehydrogenase
VSSQETSQQKWILIGGSRGLGAEFAKILESKSEKYEILSRKQGGFDVTRVEQWETLIPRLSDLGPTKIVYFSGGGPFGEYGSKAFKDHQWAFRLNFEFPAFLLHRVLQAENFDKLQQICFIGSAIAESKPDPGAASYAAAKHGLVGLVSSVQAEPHGTLDLRLYSPGYMDTGMLPANAWPRAQAGLVRSPRDVAGELYSWLGDGQGKNLHLLGS